MNEKQEWLEDLGKELYNSSLTRRISRRDFLGLTATKTAALAAGAFLAGGLVGYMLGSGKKEEVTKTVTEEVTKTVTEEVTKTVTLPVVQKVGKSYSSSAKQYEIGVLIGTVDANAIKMVNATLRYPSGGEKTIILPYVGRKRVEELGKELHVFEGRFYTQELGTHYIPVEVESKDGLVGSGVDPINVGLSGDDLKNFEEKGGNLDYLNKIWQTYLFDPSIKIDREQAMVEDFLILQETGIRDGNDESVKYLTGVTSYALSHGKRDLLQNYGAETFKNVLKVVNSQPIVVTGLSNDSNPPSYPLTYKEWITQNYPMPLQGEEYEILTLIAQDNPELFATYPNIAWALAKQAKTFMNTMHGKYSTELAREGKPRVVLEYSRIYEVTNPKTRETRKISLRNLVNKQFSNLNEMIKDGRFVLGPYPEDLLKATEGLEKQRLIADTWQRQRVFPVIHLNSASILHGSWTYDIFGYEIFTNPLLRLIILEENVDNFMNLNRKMLEVVRNEDNSYLIDLIGWFTVWAKTLPTQAKKDFQLLYEKGSEIVRLQQRIYNHSLKRTLEELKLPVGYEEWRVEYYIIGCSSVFLPAVRVHSWFGRVEGRKEGVSDGQAGFTLTKKDIDLLYKIDGDELNLEKNYSNALQPIVSRINRAKDDGIKESNIVLFDAYSQVYRKF